MMSRFKSGRNVSCLNMGKVAVAEIITRNLDVEVWEGSASSLYKRRNHTDGSAAIRLYCLADAIHQTT